jgi:hypothetical protein
VVAEGRAESPHYDAAVRRPTILVTVGAALLAAATIAIGALALAGCGDETQAPAASERADPEACTDLAPDEARGCYTREFTKLVEDEADPRPAIEAIAESAWAQGGFLLANCHGVMHTVARGYVAKQGVTLANLMDYLPRSNDPGCTAGFAHGLVTGVAPDIDPARPREAATVCGDSDTRYQRYSCTHGFGHAFMRLNEGQLEAALALCTALGSGAAPDCAQGVYHDYWFAVAGADDAKLAGEAVTDPRELCAAQQRQFVRPCWYRAFVDNRAEGFQTQSPSDFELLCGELQGLQREGCMTAASVIGPPDPAVQLQLCAALLAPDAVSCVRGTKVQNLLEYSLTTYVDLIRRCRLFGAAARTACYRWLGKTISVVTDGDFGRSGCPRLREPARTACARGAVTIDEPLVTFS